MWKCHEYSATQILREINFGHFEAPNLPFDQLLQGVPFEKSQKEMAVELKRYIFDPMLVKPKYV